MVNFVLVLLSSMAMTLLQSGPVVRIAEDVANENILRRVDPVYPTPARQARVQGVVVLEAEIDQEGAVTNLRVVSGHPLLTQAAIDAVRSWRYRSSMLKNAPKVVTTVRVSVIPPLPARQERVQIDCGPFPFVRLFQTETAEQATGTLECGEEILIFSRGITYAEVQTGRGRGWVNLIHVPVAGAAASEPPSRPIGEGQLDCAERPTAQIYDVPGANSIARLACGEKVSVLALDDPYARIRTAAGVEGWVLAEPLHIQRQ